jgi:hypothetical protein
MEPHAIPQNVTNFQFKLIGDMTLKQFLYLASGVVVAYILFVFASPVYPLISWPLILISAGLGAAFAFVPFQSRPLDVWVGAFLNAVYSPTKMVWKKNSRTYKDEALFKSRFLLYTAPQSAGLAPSNPTNSYIPIQIQKNPSTKLPSHQELKETVDLASQAQNLNMKIVQAEHMLDQIKKAQSLSSVPVDYSQQTGKVLSDLSSLIAQASAVKAKIETQVHKHANAPTNTNIDQPVMSSVKTIIPEKPKQTQVALTTFPNVINGVIKDSKNNYLEGVIVVIYDKQGLPVRALKTNKLGQFSGSTPLPNSVYKIELEKEGFAFDILQIELNGSILAPILISAKEVQAKS